MRVCVRPDRTMREQQISILNYEYFHVRNEWSVRISFSGQQQSFLYFRISLCSERRERNFRSLNHVPNCNIS